MLKTLRSNFTMYSRKLKNKDLYRVEFFVTKAVADKLGIKLTIPKEGGKVKSQEPKWFKTFRIDLDKKFEKIDNRLDGIDKRLDNIESDIKILKSLPTIARELKNG